MIRCFSSILVSSTVVCGTGLVTPAAQTSLRFEVASIRPSPAEPSGPTGLRITSGQVRFSFLSLQDYIGIAYGVRVYQIAGPGWLASTRFEINAKFPDDPEASKHMPEMMRALLEDRFKMRTHRESREFPVYTLEVAPKGLPLIRVPDEAETPGLFSVESGFSGGRKVTTLGGGATVALGDNQFEARRVTMVMLAETLSHFVELPVVDRTQLDGRYNVAFTLSPEDFQAMMTRSIVAGGFGASPETLHNLDSSSTAAIPDALERVGLLLRRRRAPLEALVIDAVDKAPREN